MKNDNYTDSEIEFRIKRTEPIYQEYLEENFNSIQHCILNTSNVQDLYKQIDNLIEYYN